MKTSKFLIGILFLLQFKFSFSQEECIRTYLMSDLYEKDSSFFSVIDSFLINETGILVEEGEFSYETVIYNLINQKNIDLQSETGLYYIGRPSSHPYFALFLKNKDGTVEFIKRNDLQEITLLFQRLNEFFSKNEIRNNDIRLKYYFLIVKYFNQISDYPISSDCLNYSWTCKPCK